MTPVRYGICILPDLTWREAAPLWQRAESMGFDHAWTYDHLVWGGLPDSRWSSCIPTLTAAAMLTSRIELGAFVISPNFRHPVSFSREVQTLVDISDGRFLVGLGAGGTPDDTLLGGSPLPPRERVDRLQEFTALLDRTLSTDHVDADGEYYRTRNMRLVGGSIRERVSLLLAGNGPRSVRFAGRHGDGWITTGPSGADTLDNWFGSVAKSSAVLDAVLAERGSSSFRRYLSLDSSPRSSVESLGLFDEMVGRATELGFTDVVLHWPRAEAPYRGSEATLEQIVAERIN